jgi:hypothetical protein
VATHEAGDFRAGRINDGQLSIATFRSANPATTITNTTMTIFRFMSKAFRSSPSLKTSRQSVHPLFNWPARGRFRPDAEGE